jgi:hypothetical protein
MRPGKRARPNWRTPSTAPHIVMPEVDDPVRQRTAPTVHSTTLAPNFAPMVQAQGKKLMAPSACVDFHPFAEKLHEWEMGVPVDCRTDWAWATIEAAVDKGAHKSATTPESIELIAEDVAYQVKAGYAKVISWTKLSRL